MGKMKKQTYDLEELLLETEELIKIFETSIKTAEKKKKQPFDICDWFSFDVGRSMLDVHFLNKVL